MKKLMTVLLLLMFVNIANAGWEKDLCGESCPIEGKPFLTKMPDYAANAIMYKLMMGDKLPKLSKEVDDYRLKEIEALKRVQ